MTSINELCSYLKSRIHGDYQNCIEFMIECTKIYHKFIPAVGIKSLEIAKDYWLEKKSGVGDLEIAKVNCWNFLDENKLSTRFDTPEACALRAMMLLLYPESDNEHPDDNLDFYFDMLSLMNISKKELEDLIKNWDLGSRGQTP